MAINFDLNDLLAFRAVAELSNFRKAAESVHLSQPAFSRRIDKLEQALGVRLLERTTRRVTLTTVGRDFERKVRELLDDLDSTLLGIRGVAATRMGEVTVACVPSTVYYYLSEVIRRYHERCPKVRVKVLDAGANEVLAAVARGEADFGLNFIGAQEGDLDFKPLVEERFVAACRRDHPLAKLKRVSWAQLAEHDYISVSRTSGNRAAARPGAGRREERPQTHLRDPARHDDARVWSRPASASPRCLDGDAGAGSPAAGERAAGRPGRHAQDRADPAPRAFAVARGAAVVRSVRRREGAASQQLRAIAPSRRAARAAGIDALCGSIVSIQQFTA